ncbi:MAG: hypothetical protein OER97_09255 [Gammaproteobacteria bacterium]|nr:hypothetical protein [Gammaproteobacteria bacterium]
MLRRVLIISFLAVQALPSPILAKEVDLDRFVDRELIPFVTQQLLTHPRFKGETLMFVILDNNTPAPISNELALSLRDRLLDAALDTNGVRIGWRQGSADRLGTTAVDCTRDDVHYYIGLELSQQVDRSYELSLHALDLEDHRWVGGFVKSWRGRLNGSQQQAIQRTQVDQTFLGARDVPFTLAQTDLLARHLAHELSCDLLRQTNGEYIVPTSTAANSDDELDGTVELIGNNIAAHSAIELTVDSDRANAALAGKAHQIDGPLYQYWLTVTPNGKDTDLTTLSASAYVVMPNTRYANMEPTTPVTVPRPQARERALPIPAAISIPNAGSDALIGPLQVHSPTSVAQCGSQDAFLQTASYWSRGRQCSLLEASTHSDAVVFVLEHQPHLGLVRLGGDNCRDRTTARVVRRGGSLRFPIAPFSTNTGQAQESDDWLVTPRVDTYYAIAISDARSARRIANHIDRLPMRCGAPSRSGLTGADLRNWLDDFAMLAAQSANHIDWRALELKDVL